VSWEQLIAMRREAAEERRAEATARPVACPNDGEPLVEGPDGRLFCPYDGWSERDHIAPPATF
jgi:uncharacterized Zn finger protein (UPF0148 family)